MMDNVLKPEGRFTAPIYYILWRNYLCGSLLVRRRSLQMIQQVLFVYSSPCALARKVLLPYQSLRRLVVANP